MKALLKRGASVEVEGPYGRRPLHYAVMKSQLQVTKELLKYGADTMSADGSKMTPIHLAIQDHKQDNDKVASLLIRRLSQVSPSA